MGSEEDRCAAAAKFQRIDESFTRGDLSALRAAVDDPASIPNGPMRIRRLEIAPHLAYGEKGVPGMIPANALIISEITILRTAESVGR